MSGFPARYPRVVMIWALGSVLVALNSAVALKRASVEGPGAKTEYPPWRSRDLANAKVEDSDAM